MKLTFEGVFRVKPLWFWQIVTIFATEVLNHKFGSNFNFIPVDLLWFQIQIILIS